MSTRHKRLEKYKSLIKVRPDHSDPYYDNRDEIDKSIKDSEAFVDALRQEIPSKLTKENE